MTFTIGLLFGASAGIIAGMVLMYVLIMLTMGRNTKENKENFERTHKDIMDAWAVRNGQAEERNKIMAEVYTWLERIAQRTGI